MRSIEASVQPRLWSYIGGIARANRMKAIAVGGTADHVHILLQLAPTAVAKAVQLIKAGSSKWMHEQVGQQSFAWQEAYGALHCRHLAIADDS
jgi:putative transposase